MATLEDAATMEWQADEVPYDFAASALPDPAPRGWRYPIISVDDHLVEPPDMFTKRVPAKYLDRAPRVVEEADGREYWLIDGGLEPNVPANAAAGRVPGGPLGGVSMRFDEMRRGVWDIHERIRDMDIGGVYASLGFPSMVFSFAGQRFLRMRDPLLGRLCVRAYNDWMAEEWAGPYPERIIPSQIVYLGDVETAASEVRRNAERGFKAVNFSENPEKLGLPSIHSGYWEPFFEACHETGTVLNLHVGSSSQIVLPSTDSPLDTMSALFAINSIVVSVDWLYSGVPQRFPDIKIVLSEGGIGWVPMLLDRLDYVHNFPRSATWTDPSLSPSDVLQRNFYFASFWDPSVWPLRERIGIDHILFEVDYPHVDSIWPDCQEFVERQLGELPEDEILQLTCVNASRLYRHALPDGLAGRA